MNVHFERFILLRPRDLGRFVMFRQGIQIFIKFFDSFLMRDTRFLFDPLDVTFFFFLKKSYFCFGLVGIKFCALSTVLSNWLLRRCRSLNVAGAFNGCFKILFLVLRLLLLFPKKYKIARNYSYRKTFKCQEKILLDSTIRGHALKLEGSSCNQIVFWHLSKFQIPNESSFFLKFKLLKIVF